MKRQTQGQRRIGEERTQKFSEIRILDTVIYVSMEYAHIKYSAMERAKAQLILGGNSKNNIEMAGRIAMQDLLLSLQAIRALKANGSEEVWLNVAITKLEKKLSR